MFVRFVGLFGSFMSLQVLWLTICTALVGYVTEGAFKQWLNRKVSIMCFGVLSSAISSLITYHNPENRPKNGICVANHTSPIDVLVLMCDNCYSLVRYCFKYVMLFNYVQKQKGSLCNKTYSNFH